MPDIIEETTYQGWPALKIWYAHYNGEDKFLILGVKAAGAVDDNIDTIRQFVDKHDALKYWKSKGMKV